MKIKKEKLPAKTCNICCESTTNYTVEDNAIICKDCKKERENGK